MPEQTQQRQDAFEIHIRLKSLEALFNSLDPSPLVERDLDDTVEDYLVDCVRDAPSGAPLELVLHLPDNSAGRVNGDAVGQSVAHYFSFLSDRQARRIRRLLREGRQAALVGVLFLAGCTLYERHVWRRDGCPFRRGVIDHRLGRQLAARLDLPLRMAPDAPAYAHLRSTRPAECRAQTGRAVTRRRLSLS